MTTKHTAELESLAKYVDRHEAEFCDDDGFIDQSLLIERFNLSKPQAIEVLRILNSSAFQV